MCSPGRISGNWLGPNADMRCKTLFDIPAGESGDVLTYRREPIEARNVTRRDIPAGNWVRVDYASGVVAILSDLGPCRE